MAHSLELDRQSLDALSAFVEASFASVTWIRDQEDGPNRQLVWPNAILTRTVVTARNRAILEISRVAHIARADASTRYYHRLYEASEQLRMLSYEVGWCRSEPETRHRAIEDSVRTMVAGVATAADQACVAWKELRRRTAAHSAYYQRWREQDRQGYAEGWPPELASGVAACRSAERRWLDEWENWHRAASRGSTT